MGIVINCLTTGLAHADDWYPYYNEDEYTAFYTPPIPLPDGVPGDLIRTEPSRLVLEPSGQLGAIMATGTRIMYRSTDARGRPNAVTGTYFELFQRLARAGPRPLIVYGPGTQGQGDQCAPSRLFNQGIHWSPYLDFTFNYEELFVATMVARGFAIVMTDYEGLGTPACTAMSTGSPRATPCSTPAGQPCACRERPWIRKGRWPSGDTHKAGSRRLGR